MLYLIIAALRTGCSRRALRPRGCRRHPGTLRLVPDDTKFDFMRFRRIESPFRRACRSSPFWLYLYDGLNFGIDFVGGTLMEVQAKAGNADLAQHALPRSTGSPWATCSCSSSAAPPTCSIASPQQPGGEEAQQAAVRKVRDALGDQVDYRSNT